MTLRAALEPRSVAIVGASDNPHKVGGRPILFMKRYGYRGAIYPVNPGRAEVQGLKLPGGVPCFSAGTPRAVLAAAGLTLQHSKMIDAGVSQESWMRETVEGFLV